MVIGGVSVKQLTTFTRQFSTLQDAGLPVLRSLRILEHQLKPGVLKNALIDVVEDVESGSTLSEAFGKHPKCFDRLYVNMVKAGEAGGASPPPKLTRTSFDGSLWPFWFTPRTRT